MKCFPIEINPNIPKSLNEIILKARRKDTTLRYQSATEMLRDLNRALKEPDGDFVDNEEYNDTDSTRVIPTLNNEEIRTENKSNNKKENFFTKHKKLTIFLIVFVLFLLSIFGTNLVMRLTTPKEVDIPNLVGITREEAEKAISDRKLQLGEVKEEYNSEYEKGKVISQDPPYRENYNIKEGTTIKFVVSLGIEETTVPKVVGLKQEEAIKALEDAKLKYEIKEENSKKVEAGYVIEQETEAEKTVNAGDKVVIHVSLGVKKISVPSVLGKSEKDATKALKDVGLKVVTTTDEDSSKDNDTVLKQSVDAGTEVEEGTSVTITINSITQTKNATLTINVKSILGGKYTTETKDTGKKDEEGNPIKEEKIKNVKVRIEVESNKKTYIVYNEDTDPTMTNLIQSCDGKGTITVRVYVDDVLKKTKQINLNETNKLTIE